MVILSTCYFYGLFGAFHAKSTKEDAGQVNGSRSVGLPYAVMMSFSSAVCGVYVLFFLVKFSDILAKAFSHQQSFVYSDYARQGFLNSVLFPSLTLACSTFYQRYSAIGRKKTVKLMLSLLCAETLGFIMLAFSKMCLYIGVYGFTFKSGIYQLVYGSAVHHVFQAVLLHLETGQCHKNSVLFASATFLLLAYSNMEDGCTRQTR